MAISEVAVDPPGRVARLSYVEGAVSFASADAGDWTDAVLNRPLTSGDRLWLDQDARAELEVGSTTLHLDRETAFGFVKLDDGVLLASLTEGAASIRVRSLGDQEAIQVETPNATVRIRARRRIQPGSRHRQRSDDRQGPERRSRGHGRLGVASRAREPGGRLRGRR